MNGWFNSVPLSKRRTVLIWPLFGPTPIMQLSWMMSQIFLYLPLRRKTWMSYSFDLLKPHTSEEQRIPVNKLNPAHFTTFPRIMPPRRLLKKAKWPYYPESTVLSFNPQQKKQFPRHWLILRLCGRKGQQPPTSSPTRFFTVPSFILAVPNTNEYSLTSKNSNWNNEQENESFYLF